MISNSNQFLLKLQRQAHNTINATVPVLGNIEMLAHVVDKTFSRTKFLVTKSIIRNIYVNYRLPIYCKKVQKMQ